MKKHQTKHVFVPGGMPHLTYVPRSDLRLEVELRTFDSFSNKLIVITGDTKSGKTVLASRVFPPEESIWIDGGTVQTEQDLWSLILDEVDAYTEYSLVQSTEKTRGVEAAVKAQGSVLVVKGETEVKLRFEGPKDKTLRNLARSRAGPLH